MIKIDLEKARIIREDESGAVSYPFGSPEAFSLISKIWLRCGWDTKYIYSFTWLGRPIIQLPEDMIRIQEVIYQVKPDVIIETGVAHGGSLVFYASLLKAMGHPGRVIGVDIDIRPPNRKAIEGHEMFDCITLVEGNSVEAAVVAKIKSMVKEKEKVMVVLDSSHSKAHVSAELNAYSDLVSIGSYIVTCDGIMESLLGAPRSKNDWSWNNPKAAAEDFLKSHSNFAAEEPSFLFNEGMVAERITYWPNAFLKRIK